MVNLYATITYDHHAGRASRTGHREIKTTAETWRAKIKVRLHKDGHATINLTDKHNYPLLSIWEGNIDELETNIQ